MGGVSGLLAWVWCGGGVRWDDVGAGGGVSAGVVLDLIVVMVWSCLWS